MNKDNRLSCPNRKHLGKGPVRGDERQTERKAREIESLPNSSSREAVDAPTRSWEQGMF